MNTRTPGTGTLILIGIAALAGILLLSVVSLPPSERHIQINTSSPESDRQETSFENTNLSEEVSIVAQGLEVPWEIVFLPDSSGQVNGRMLITERPGTIKIIEESGITKSITIEGVRHTGEGGLLGAALHPNFAENRLVYLYKTVREGLGTENEVVRYRLQDEELIGPQTIISGIPGASHHDGGRIAFGPDGMLYVTTGDAGDSDSAQDIDVLSGKILRLTPEGEAPEDNPFASTDSAQDQHSASTGLSAGQAAFVYSYGHRNPQGIAWDESERLWITEHGRSGLRSGFDELNLIVPGGNYGWPEIQGDESQEGMVRPVIHSGPQITWAPAGIAFADDALFFAGLRGTSLYRAEITEEQTIRSLETILGDDYGRLRAVTVGPDGALYISTSNTDGRGDPQDGDDKILRVEIGEE